MEGRRFRRQTRTRGGDHTLLPIRSPTSISNTLSYWYCDLKITALNQPLYQFGQTHSRFLRVWFTVGIGFSLSLLFGVTLLLVWELVTSLWLSNESNRLNELFESLLFGVSPSGFGFKMSLADLGYLVVSTLISVAVHEFGHAVSAASEGIQLEYIAIFLAVFFPGALVAFNYEVLQVKPRSSALRIYCAGIWHNAVCCAACGFALLMLPSILSAFYIRGDNPMVLEVSASSPLSSYLSPGDVIMSIDGTKIHKALDWKEMAISLAKQSLETSEFQLHKGHLTMKRKTYCAPISLLEKSERLFSVSNQSACSNEHIAFASVPCFDFSAHSVGNIEFVAQKVNDNGYCLSSADAVKLKSCGSVDSVDDPRRSCICSQDEVCLSPVQMPGVVWAEITFQSPHDHRCNLTSFETSNYGESCYKTFLYVGDATALAHSVKLAAYLPRIVFPFGAYLPHLLENFFVWTFQVSVALALLNSLPVYFLDGESILETSSLYITILSPGRLRLLLRACLFGGSILSCVVFLRTLFIKFW